MDDKFIRHLASPAPYYIFLGLAFIIFILLGIVWFDWLYLYAGPPTWKTDWPRYQYPVGVHVRPDKSDEGQNRLIIKVYHFYGLEDNTAKCDAHERGLVCQNSDHWRIEIQNKYFMKADNPEFIKLLEAESLSGKKNMSDRISERLVMLKVEQYAPYGLVNALLRTFRRAGIYKVEVAAGVKWP